MKCSIEPFEDELQSLKDEFTHGAFEYSNPQVSFTSISKSHFEANQRDGSSGVYVIRRKSIGEVLYIGKGGTVGRSGQYQNQGILGRLNNTRSNGAPANNWFAGLVAEYNDTLVIEYLILNPTLKSPAFVESVLLQAYLNEHGCLPVKNSEL